jgi:hypothetical protein
MKCCRTGGTVVKQLELRSKTDNFEKRTKAGGREERELFESKKTRRNEKKGRFCLRIALESESVSNATEWGGVSIGRDEM